MTEQFPRRAAIAVVLLSALAVIPPADAQVLFGSIVGTATDATGAAVPGARVTVTQIETNDSREATTNEAGSYTLSTVRTGAYKISVSKEGFKTYTIDNVPVGVNTVVRVDAGLELGTQQQTVEIRRRLCKRKRPTCMWSSTRSSSSTCRSRRASSEASPRWFPALRRPRPAREATTIPAGRSRSPPTALAAAAPTR
jgi:hypothetical protein